MMLYLMMIPADTVLVDVIFPGAYSYDTATARFYDQSPLNSIYRYVSSALTITNVSHLCVARVFFLSNMLVLPPALYGEGAGLV